jgi:GNAT superfamily N-acetyltransferase
VNVVVSVRRAQITDAGDLARLTSQLGYEIAAADAATRLARVLARHDHVVLIAEAGGATVGWLHASVSLHLDTDTCVLIEGIVVNREHRRQGIGEMLLARAEAWGVERGCSMVRLRSTSTRLKAHKFYEKLGYTVVKAQLSFAKGLNAAGRDAVKQLVPRVQE